MKIIKGSVFKVATNQTTYEIKVSLTENEIVISVQDQKNEGVNHENCKVNLTKEQLINNNKIFSLFDSLQKIVDGLSKQIDQGPFEFKKTDQGFVLSFSVFGLDVKFDIPFNDAKTAEIPNGTIPDYQNKIKALTEELNAQKKIVETLRKQNLKYEKEKSNLTLYISEVIQNAVKESEKEEESKVKKIDTHKEPESESKSKKEQQEKPKPVQEKPKPKPAQEKESILIPATNPTKMNFVTQKANLVKELVKAHSDWVYSLCALKDGRLASCSEDCMIKVFNLKDYSCEIEIEAHHKPVSYLTQLHNGLLASSSFDQTIKIWNISKNSLTLTATLEGHYNHVNKVIQLNNGKLCSCGDDSRIKIWEGSEPYSCIKTLKGHAGSVRSIIQLRNQNILVSGGWDFCLIFWNLETFECLKVVRDILCNWNTCLVEIKGKVIVGAEEISIVDLKEMEIEQKFKIKGVNRIYSMLTLSESDVLCGCQVAGNFSLMDFDFIENKLNGIKRDVHDGLIFGLVRINDNLIGSCALDGDIRIWGS